MRLTTSTASWGIPRPRAALLAAIVALAGGAAPAQTTPETPPTCPSTHVVCGGSCCSK